VQKEACLSSREEARYPLNTKFAILGLLLILVPELNLTAVDSIVMEGDLFPPYVTAGGPVGPGFVVEVLESILTKAGYNVSFRLTPWTRAVRDVQAGQADLLLLSTADEAVRNGLTVTREPLGMAVLRWYTGKASTWTFSGVDSLKGQVWAVIEGYPYPFQNYIQANKTDESKITVATGETAMEHNLKKLAAGRGTVLLDDQTVVEYTVKSLGLQDEIRPAGLYGDPLPMYPLFLAQRQGSQRLSAQISDGIRSLRQSRELRKILAKYNVKDWEPRSGG